VHVPWLLHDPDEHPPQLIVPPHPSGWVPHSAPIAWQVFGVQHWFDPLHT
jgi:hypothetical protein